MTITPATIPAQLAGTAFNGAVATFTSSIPPSAVPATSPRRSTGVTAPRTPARSPSPGGRGPRSRCPARTPIRQAATTRSPSPSRHGSVTTDASVPVEVDAAQTDRPVRRGAAPAPSPRRCSPSSGTTSNMRGSLFVALSERSTDCSSSTPYDYAPQVTTVTTTGVPSTATVPCQRQVPPEVHPGPARRQRPGLLRLEPPVHARSTAARPPSRSSTDRPTTWGCCRRAGSCRSVGGGRRSVPDPGSGAGVEDRRRADQVPGRRPEVPVGGPTGRPSWSAREAVSVPAGRARRRPRGWWWRRGGALPAARYSGDSHHPVSASSESNSSRTVRPGACSPSRPHVVVIGEEPAAVRGEDGEEALLVDPVAVGVRHGEVGDEADGCGGHGQVLSGRRWAGGDGQAVRSADDRRGDGAVAWSGLGWATAETRPSSTMRRCASSHVGSSLSLLLPVGDVGLVAPVAQEGHDGTRGPPRSCTTAWRRGRSTPSGSRRWRWPRPAGPCRGCPGLSPTWA